MRLTHAKLLRARGVDLAFGVDAPGVVVVTGPAVSGKTAVLESIIAVKEAAGGYGPAPTVTDYLSPGEPGSIEIGIELDEPEQVSAGAATRKLTPGWDLGVAGPQALAPAPVRELLRRYHTAPSGWKMEYFNAGRQLTDAGSLRWADGTQRLSKRREKYGWVRQFLVDSSQADAASTLTSLREQGIVLGGDGRPRKNSFAEALAVLTPRLAWIGSEKAGPEWACLFARAPGRTVELAALSDSEKMCVLVAASFDALGLARSLVLIDLPEHGLHPEDQAAFFQGFCALFAEGQVIATTSSPAILRSIRREQVVVLGGSR